MDAEYRDAGDSNVCKSMFPTSTDGAIYLAWAIWMKTIPTCRTWVEKRHPDPIIAIF